MPLFIECELGRRRKIEYSAEQRRTSWITHFRWNPHVSHEFNLCPLWWSVSSMQYSLGHLNNAAFHTRTNLIFCRFHPYNKHNTQTSKTNIFPLRTQIFSHRFTFTPNCLPREYHCCIYNILPSFKTTKTHHNLSIHRIISADKTDTTLFERRKLDGRYFRSTPTTHLNCIQLSMPGHSSFIWCKNHWLIGSYA
jgi:hypothetical protein